MTQSTNPSPAPNRKKRIIGLGLLLIGLILVICFGLRMVRSYLRIYNIGREPSATEVESIRGWMTIPYISTAYSVPEEYIFEQIGIPQEDNQHKSLGRLSHEYAGGERNAIFKAVKEAIKQYQAENPASPEPGYD